MNYGWRFEQNQRYLDKIDRMSGRSLGVTRNDKPTPVDIINKRMLAVDKAATKDANDYMKTIRSDW